MRVLRRTGWVLVSQDPQHAAGPTGKNNPRKDTHGATLLWKKSIQLSSAVDRHCYPEKKLYYSGVFVSIEFTVSLYYCFLSDPTLSYQSKVEGKRRWWKRLLYVFSVFGTDGIACCSQWFWQVFETCSFLLWYPCKRNCRVTLLHVWPRRRLLDTVMCLPCLLWCLLKSI